MMLSKNAFAAIKNGSHGGASPAFANYSTKSKKLIDLRSDTVTRPSQKMQQAMMTCPLGDDVWGTDPTVNEMQSQMASFFGKDKAIIFPSGTQSNLTALLTHVRNKGDSAIMGNKCHIYKYERGGSAALGGIFPHVIANNPDGTFDIEALKGMIPPVSEHLPQPRVICLENSQGGSNGAAITLDFVKEVKAVADENDIKLHLDGARLLNALIATGDDPVEYCKPFDTISFCFSKGMGCPIGSILVGSERDIQIAKENRKLLGGWMRQSGLLAACMQVSMEDWQDMLKVDNDNCAFIANELNDRNSGTHCDISTVHTNMVHFFFDENVKGIDPATLCGILREKYDILTIPSFTNDCIRIVTHRDVTREDLNFTQECIKAELRPYI